MDEDFTLSSDDEIYGANEPPVHDIGELEDDFNSAATQQGDLSQTLAPPATFESPEPGLPLLNGVPWNP